MALQVLTPVDAEPAAIPRQRTTGNRGISAIQLPLFQVKRGRYCRVVTVRSQWQSYIEDAIEAAGGVTALARAAGLDVGTIHRWRRGATADGRLDSIRKVARAVGDDPRNALRAAGRDGEDPHEPPAPAGEREIILADLLEDVLRLPISDDRKVTFAAGIIALYRQGNREAAAQYLRDHSRSA